MREFMIAKIIFLSINATLAVLNIAVALIVFAIFGIVAYRKRKKR
jgi:uncharacterized protein YneF (UPF0154 family)